MGNTIIFNLDGGIAATDYQTERWRKAVKNNSRDYCNEEDGDKFIEDFSHWRKIDWRVDVA